MKSRLVFVVAFLAALICLMPSSTSLIDVSDSFLLSLIEVDTDNKVYSKVVRPGDLVSLGWEHSHDRALVIETFIISSQGVMVPHSIRYKSDSYDARDLAYENCTWEYDSVTKTYVISVKSSERVFESIPIRVARKMEHYIVVNEERVSLPEVARSGSQLVLKIEK